MPNKQTVRYVSAKLFGAIGDGVHNDAAAIQAAITNCRDSSGYKETAILLEPGTYLIPAGVTIVMPDGVTLEGSGDDAMIQIGENLPSANHTAFLVAAGASAVFQNVKFVGPANPNGMTIRAVDHGGVSGTLSFIGVTATGTASTRVQSGARFLLDLSNDIETTAANETYTYLGDWIWVGGDQPRIIKQVGGLAPNNAPGYAAPEGSLFMHFVSGAGANYIKTGAADTAWALSGGGSTTAGFVQFAGDPAYALTIYLDGVNGSDANDGLTTATALRTYGEIMTRFPQILFGGASILVIVAGTGGSPFTAPATPCSYEEGTFIIPGPGKMFTNGFSIRAAPKCAAVPTAGPAVIIPDSIEEVDQLNAPAPGAGFRTRFNCATQAPGWTANQLRASTAGRMFVRVTRAGVTIIPDTPVAENGTDWVIIDIPCSAQVLITDTITLVRCSVQFTGSVADLGVSLITGGGAQDTLAAGKSNTIEGVEFVGAPNFDNFIGALEGCASSVGVCHFLDCQVTLMQCNLGTTAFYRATINRFQGTLREVPTFSTSTYRVSFQGVGTMTIGDQITAPGWVGCHDCISHYAGSSLRVFGNGAVLSMLGSGSARLMGSGSTGSGLWARYGGKIIVNNFPRVQKIGATGALRVGANATVVNYGTGAGQFEEVAGYNGNFYRMNGSVPAAPTGDVSQIVVSTVS